MHTLVFDHIGDIDVFVLDFDSPVFVGLRVVKRKGQGCSSDSLVQGQLLAEHQFCVGLAASNVVD